MTEPAAEPILTDDNADASVGAGPPAVAFEVRRAPDDPTRWIFMITQPAVDVDVDPRYLATGDAAAAAIAAAGWEVEGMRASLWCDGRLPAA